MAGVPIARVLRIPPTHVMPTHEVTTQMSNMFFDLSMLAYESQQAIWLRTIKLSTGGPAADREAKLMVDEKLSAAMQAAGKLIGGAHPSSVVKAYRRKVRANVRRLSKS